MSEKWIDTDSHAKVSKDRLFLQLVIVGKTPAEDRLYSVPIEDLFQLIAGYDSTVYFKRFEG